MPAPLDWCVCTGACLQVVSASSDATVRIWDAKTCECLHAIR
jgi:WD40 repeat protein